MPRSTTPPLTPTNSSAITDLKISTYHIKSLLEQTPPQGQTPPLPQDQGEDIKQKDTTLHDILLKELLSPGGEETDLPEVIVQTGLMGHNRVTMITVPSVVLITPTPPHDQSQSQSTDKVKVNVNVNANGDKDKRDKEESKIEIYPYPLNGTARCTSNLIKRFSSDYLSGLFLDEPRTRRGFSIKLSSSAVSGQDEFMLNEAVRNIFKKDDLLGGEGCTEILFKREEGDSFREIELDPLEAHCRTDNEDENGERPAQDDNDEGGKKVAFSPATLTDKDEKATTPKIGRMLIGYRFVRQI